MIYNKFSSIERIMFKNDQLKKTIISLRKEKVPAVVLEVDNPEMLEFMRKQILSICNEIGLQVLCEQMGKKLQIRNLFFSNN